MRADKVCAEYPERGFFLKKDKGENRCRALLFPDCGLSEITIPDVIDGYVITVFEALAKLPEKLRRLTLPKTTEELRINYNNEAFGKQTLELIIAEDNPYLFSDGKAVYSKDGKTLIRFVAGGCKNYEIRSGVRFIKEMAFSNMTRLRSLSLPDSVSGIGAAAFRNCTGIRELHIPDGVRNIGARAFRGMTSLRTVNLPRSLRVLKTGTFVLCTSLEALHIPASVEEICVDSVFTNCDQRGSMLRGITVDEDNPCFTAQNGILYSKDKTRLIFAPVLAVGERFAVPDGVTEIAAGAFQCNNVVEEIVLPPSVAVIGEKAFSNCKRLRTVNLENAAVLGKYAFEGCTRLESVSLSCETIPDHAFSKCHHLKSVTLKNTRVIGEYAFFHCENQLERIILSESMERLDNGAFYKCKKLSVSLPRSLKYIGQFSLEDTREAVIPEGFDAGQLEMLWQALNCADDIAVRDEDTGEILFKVATPHSGSADFELYDIARRCFSERGFDFEEYDREILLKLNSGIFTIGKADTAFLRLEYPRELSDTAREGYLGYLAGIAAQIAHMAALNDEFAMIERCMRHGIITAENITAAAAETVKYGRTEFTAALLEYKSRNFPDEASGGLFLE